MTHRSSPFVSLRYSAVLTLLVCFLLLLITLGIEVAPAAAQSEPWERPLFSLPPLRQEESPAGRPPAPIVRTAVVLDFKSSVTENFWQTLKAELQQTEISSSLERPVVWLRYDQFHKGLEFPEILQVRLHGNCSSMDLNSNPSQLGPLGWAYIVSGQIQPFAGVDCDRIRHALAPALRLQSHKVQHQAMARAIARVISHELTHILTQNTAHASTGLQKSSLTPTDLTQPSMP